LKNRDGKSLDALVKEAEEASFSGWDFSYLEGRYVYGKLGWDYPELARRRIRKSHSVLDIGTGGGEPLSSLQPFPHETFANDDSSFSDFCLQTLLSVV